MPQDQERIFRQFPPLEMPRVERTIDDQQNDKDENAPQNSILARLSL